MNYSAKTGGFLLYNSNDCYKVLALLMRNMRIFVSIKKFNRLRNWVIGGADCDSLPLPS